MPPPPNRPPRVRLSDEIRDAIEADPRASHAIAREAGLAPSVLSRFLLGLRGLTTDSLDRLAPVLGLRLVAPRRAATRPRRPAPGEKTSRAPEAS